MADDYEGEDWAKPVDLEGVVHVCSATPKKTIEAKGLSDQAVNKDSHGRTIVHIDLDCYYAQVEMVRNPSLRNKPLGIQQKYLLVTCNYVARSHGVTKLMRVTEALKRCPDLVIVSGEDLTLYREMSYRITELLHQFSPLVERLGFDENFIDVTSLVDKRQGGVRETDVIGHLCGETSIESGVESTSITHRCTCGCHQRLLIGSHIAQEMRQALNAQLGLTSCAGVAHNKLLAKLVGSTHKPNDQTTLWPHMTGHLMGRLTKATQVPGIGHSTGKKLLAMGITTLTELIEAPFAVLKDEFGYQTASVMQKLCQGHDESPVIQSGPPQSISDEDSFKKCSTLQQARLKITTLLKSLLLRLRKDGRQPRTLRLSVRKYSKVHKWSRESRQCILPDGVLHSLHSDEVTAMSKLLDHCMSLFHKMVDVSQPFHLTLISVGFAKFQLATTKTSSSDISKFFVPRSAKKGRDNESVVSEGFKRTADAEEDLFESNKKSQDNMTKNETESFKLTNEIANGYKLGSACGRCIPASSHRESVENLSKNGAKFSLSHEGSCLVSSMSPVKHLNKNRTSSYTSETDLKMLNEHSSTASSSKPGKGISDSITNISPKKGTSFFALKSNKTKLDKFETKTSVSEHFKSQQEAPKCDMEDQKSAPMVETGTCQSRAPLMASTQQTSPQEENKEPVGRSQVVNKAHFAIPPQIDPLVFAELPMDVQQELFNDWQKKTTSRSDSAIDCTRASSSQSDLVEFPDIDHSVFKELPPDIQNEILEQQKQNKRTLASWSPASQRTGSAKRPRNAKTLSEKGVNIVKNKCIKDFFGPK